MGNPETIMMFSAHPDDEIFGAGGTIAKYAEEKKQVISLVFSYGESSHFWLQKKFTAEMRVKELRMAESIVGCHESIFFGFSEGRFNEMFRKRRIRESIKKIILDKKPVAIFTHSSDDPHPDHRATASFVSRLVNSLNSRGHHIDVYTFDVWNPLNLKKSDYPKLVVDISKTFRLKMKALQAFESQKQLPAIIPLIWSISFKALLYGLSYGYRYAEVFYKVQ